MRKTINTQKFIEIGNELLANEKLSQEIKKGICTLIEKTLLEHNSYRGFNYSYWINGGYDQWIKDGQPDFPEKEKYITDNKKKEYNRIYYTN